MNLTQLAHDLIDTNFDIDPIKLDFINKNRINNAIDATCGNGNDSLFLSKRSNRLMCFDIQAEAIERTKDVLKLSTVNCSIEHLQMGHENILEQTQLRGLKSNVDVVMFNLGFLPKSNSRHITTTLTTTLQALQQSMQCLNNNGVISLLCYRGHDGGSEEFDAVKALLDQAGDGWQVQQFDSAKANDTTPVLLFLTKTT